MKCLSEQPEQLPRFHQFFCFVLSFLSVALVWVARVPVSHPQDKVSRVSP